MRRFYRLAAIAIAALVPSRLHAQTQPILVPGDSVRIFVRSANPPQLTRTLFSVKSDTLLLRGVGPADSNLAVPFDRIEQMEVYRLDGRTRAGKSALIGLVTGFVTVGVAGLLATLNAADYKGIGVILAPVGGGAGAAIGALWGHARRVPGWKRVQIPARPKTAVSPTRDASESFQRQ